VVHHFLSVGPADAILHAELHSSRDLGQGLRGGLPIVVRTRGVVRGVAGRAHVFARGAGEVAGAALFGHLAVERALATQRSLHLHGRAGRERGNP
jgi:hypothetical protein